MQGTDERRCRALLVTVYAALALLVVVEKWGETTNDTRLELTETPGHYLAGTFHLWNPGVSLGELQNQAYGYLFPQGPFYALLHAAHVPGWLSERLWSVLVLLVACEGVRRLTRALGIGPWGAAAAGLAYGLVPRAVTELGVRSAEILPGAVLPWALLPIVLAWQRRMHPRNAAVLSAAAFACGGGVNGTATAAPAALLAIVVAWAVWQRRLSWRFGLGWFALIGAVSAWWAVALLRLGAYSPPFYDFVEDARTTTGSSGFAATLRGASNWVGYLTVGGRRWWPAGYDLAYEPWLVLGTGLLAVLGVVGLLRLRGPLRTPLLLAAGFGIACQVIAHTGPLDSPIGQWLQDLLDGPLAPLRNVPKADPVLRVPLCVGVGVLVDDVVRVLARPRRLPRRLAAAGLVVALVGGLVAAAQPIAAADTRTPGWNRIPSYWTDAAHYLRDHDAGTTWVIPGSGFGIQQWGWTMEEPFEAVAESPWVTRSQVPLTPPETIRVLSALESFLETGAGSPYLRNMLDRMGIDHVLVRHDLEPQVSQVTSGSLVGVALARSPGLDRVATFGRLTFGPAIEVYQVRRAAGTETGTGGYDLRDVADAVTVAGSVEAAVAAVGSGLVAPAQPIVLAGAAGWDRKALVAGDEYRLRERAFGRIHDAESNVMAPGERYRAGRVLPNYPGAPGAKPVVARYGGGVAGIDASSSRGWADTIGPVQPENAPWSALDGSEATYWQSMPLRDPRGQWLEVRLDGTRPIGRVTLEEPTAELGVDHVGRWRVTAGRESRVVTTDPFTGRGSVDLGVRADRVRVEVLAAPSRSSSVGLAELTIDGIRPTRTLVLPTSATDGPPDLIFEAQPALRACVTTLLGPDCDRNRRRASEEETGIDRTFRLDAAGSWRMRGLVVARSRPGTLELLQPQRGVRMTGSSWFAQDPTVSPRMAYDGDPGTSWIADPRDPEPTLSIDLGRERTLRRLGVSAPAGGATLPDHAVLRAETGAGAEVRHADLRGYGGFAPLRARRITITFSRSTPTAGQPLGIGDLSLGGARVAVPIDGAAPTGSVCGYGPELVVDGRTVKTRVEGLMGDVVAGGRLAVVPCGARRLDLAAGEHHVALRSTEQFQPVGLTLTAPHGGTASLPRAERSRDLRLLSSDDAQVRLRVGPGEDAILSAPHNVNAGWVATLDGHRLKRITVDGWAQGWVVPAGLSGDVRLTFAPQRSYLVALVGGLVLLGAVLLWALALLVLPGRRRRPDAAVATERPPRRPLPLAANLLLAAVAGLLIGGPVAAPAAIAGVLLARRPRLVQALVGVTLLGALVALVLVLEHSVQRPPAAIDLVTGAALALGLAAALTRRPERP
jgi:arabinofuranan 3-O-arabinosyltransferase